MTEPVAGGKMACKTHHEVQLEPPKKVKKGEDDAKAAPKKAARKKATKKKAARKKAAPKASD